MVFQGSLQRNIQSYLTGITTASPNVEDILAAMIAPAPGKVRMVVCGVSGAGGGGATDTIIDVRKNGQSMYANLGRRPTLPAGQTGRFITYPPDNNTVAPGDVLTLVLAQAGVNAQVVATVAIEEP